MIYTLSDILYGNRLKGDITSKNLFTRFFEQAHKVAPEHRARIPCLVSDPLLGASVRLPILGTGSIMDSRVVNGKLELLLNVSGSEFTREGTLHNIYSLTLNETGEYTVLGKKGIICYGGIKHTVENTLRVQGSLNQFNTNPTITGTAYLVYVALRWYNFDLIPEISTPTLLQPKILSWENFYENH